MVDHSSASWREVLGNDLLVDSYAGTNNVDVHANIYRQREFRYAKMSPQEAELHDT